MSVQKKLKQKLLINKIIEMLNYGYKIYVNSYIDLGTVSFYSLNYYDQETFEESLYDSYDVEHKDVTKYKYILESSFEEYSLHPRFLYIKDDKELIEKLNLENFCIVEPTKISDLI